MAERQTAKLLLVIEERVNSAHALLEEVYAKLEQLAAENRARPLSNFPARNEDSAEINLFGLKGSVSREWWERHGDKLKLVFLTLLSGYAGWVIKVLHLHLAGQ